MTLQRAERADDAGIFILIAKKEAKFRILISRSYRRALGPSKTAIEKAFLTEFKKKDFDAGLIKGVETIADMASSAHAQFGSLRETAGQPGRRNNVAVGRGGIPARRGAGGFGLGSLLGIGLLIIGVLFLVRMVGALFGGGARYGAPGRMGGPGYGPGYGGGGGGGGGFMSGLLGGLGGAVAGNWLYDQFSGRHHGGYSDSTGADAGATPDASPADEWGGGTGATGDFGGGDAGGGGDWGGGGGDWGGGGGGGGGDW